MSSLDDQLLIIRASIDGNKEDDGDKMKKLGETLAYIIDKIIENIGHIFHHIRI